MFNQLLTPARLNRLYRWLAWPSFILAALLLAYGARLALVTSPPDYQQGEAVRIMYVHVPSAWFALLLYAGLGLCGVSYLVWRNPVADLLAQAIAPVGACFCLVTLITGSLWGKPMWGTWWVWDARLTSMLILFLLYGGYIGISESISSYERAAKTRAFVAILGGFNLPIIKFSVDWWNTLHQPSSILSSKGMAIAAEMQAPLFTMTGGFFALAVWLVLLRIKTLLLMKKYRRKYALQPTPVPYSTGTE